MDFGKILDQWEQTPKKETDSNKRRNSAQFAHMLERYLPDEDTVKNKQTGTPAPDACHKGFSRKQLRAMDPQSEIDLHGARVREAMEKIEGFLHESRRKGCKKVLIVHGKGIHSNREPVLNRAVRQYLEKSPLAGEFGLSEKRWGGKGATWVILR